MLCSYVMPGLRFILSLSANQWDPQSLLCLLFKGTVREGFFLVGVCWVVKQYVTANCGSRESYPQRVRRDDCCADSVLLSFAGSQPALSQPVFEGTSVAIRSKP